MLMMRGTITSMIMIVVKVVVIKKIQSTFDILSSV